MTTLPTGKTAHVDTFARDSLPPPGQWPEMDYSGLSVTYPDQLNCAAELLDRPAEVHGHRPVVSGGGRSWTYAELLDRAGRIANVLVEDLGIEPGNRVLLRAPNTPMMVACWFAVIKAGAVAVATMPLLRWRELVYMADKAEVELALRRAAHRGDGEGGRAKPHPGADGRVR